VRVAQHTWVLARGEGYATRANNIDVTWCALCDIGSDVIPNGV